MRAAAVFERGVLALSQAAWWLAATLMAAAVAVICQMVFIRYMLNGSTVWQTEFVIYAITATVFLAAPQTLAERGHVRIDLVVANLGPRGHLALELLAALVALMFLGVLAWSGWHWFWLAWSQGWLTETAWALPLWIPLLPPPLGLSLLCLQYLAQMARELRAWRAARP